MNLIDIIQERASSLGDKPAYIFLRNGEDESKRYSYAEFERLTASFAAHFQSRLAQGGRAVLLIPEEEIFVPAFWGCIFAGVLPVPCPAFNPQFIVRTLPRIQAILKDIADADGNFGLVTTSEVKEEILKVLGGNDAVKGLKWILVSDLAEERSSSWKKPALGSSPLAFLQYTSGSTGMPKGVIVSHQNVIHNTDLILKLRESHDPGNTDAVGINWLPLFHDMGLIGAAIRPQLHGETAVCMKPMDFLQKPVRWLRAVTKYRGTWAISPNFGYELCVQKVTPEMIRELDLSTWVLAMNGAETVRTSTLEAFVKRFSACGLRNNVFVPVYGLAEGTVFVSGFQPGQRTSVRADTELLKAGEVKPAEDGQATLVNCGTWTGQEVRIVDPDSRKPLANGRIGEIWVSGKSVAQGYWNRPKETEETFHAHIDGEPRTSYLRTGDLGFLWQGGLYISGRIKDLIIIRGKNHHPQDIEYTVEQADSSIRPGCSAAFSVDVDGQERLVVVAEVKDLGSPEAAATLEKKVRAAVTKHHDLALHDIVFIRPGESLKTTSGKIQRQLTRKKWMQGAFAKGEEGKKAA